MAYDYAKLRERIVEKYGSYTAFAKTVGIPAQRVSAKLSGKSQFCHEDICTWSRFLDLPLSEVRSYFFD